MTKCEYCGKEIILPFVCPYCGQNFCSEHRLPESHECTNLPKKPLFWYQRARAIREPVKTSQKSSDFKEESEFHFIRKDRRRKALKHGNFLGAVINRNFFLSLKFWFPIFLISVFLLSYMESSNPTEFYHNTSDLVRYLLYVFAGVVGLWSGYAIFKKCDYEPRTEKGIFGLKLLSSGILVVSIFTLVFAFFVMVFGLLIKQEISLSREILFVFLFVLSLVLSVLSSYLLFKFQRRSGIIVYRH